MIFSASGPAGAGYDKKIALPPAAIDALISGSLADLLTPGLAIEVLSSGKKHWRFRRQVAGTSIVGTMFGGLFPAQTLAVAHESSRELNEQVEGGIDPRPAPRAKEARESMTVAKAHALYRVAVQEGRSSRAKRPNKPRTIKNKLEIYARDIAPKLGSRSVYAIAETDLINLVEAKGNDREHLTDDLAVVSQHEDFPRQAPPGPSRLEFPQRFKRTFLRHDVLELR